MMKRMHSALATILKKAFYCTIERRLPFRKLHGKRLVKRGWYKRLASERKKTRKIKVGFGPVISSEYDLHFRKWRIDPIVTCINEISEKYFAGIFITAEEIQQFDLIVIVREIDWVPISTLNAFKRLNKVLMYDIVDRPYYTDDIDKKKTFEVMNLADGLIASSPLHNEDLAGLKKKIVLIEHPIINTRQKNYAKPKQNTLKIIWQGFPEHLPRMATLQPIIKKLNDELREKIILNYHTKIIPKNDGHVQYKAWTVHNWEKMLVQSDIGVEIKLLQDAHLQRKPSTKIVSYMAAGLPVVCTPSVADRLVIEHGRTGYFAYTDEDWYHYLKTLAENPVLREKMGHAAREYVFGYFSIQKITQKYLDFFDALIHEAKGST